MPKKLRLFAVLAFLIPGSALTQGILNQGTIHGNVNLTLQQFNEDTLIDAVVPDAESALNAYANILYTNGGFTAGLRYETYLNSLPGYPDRFKGTGIGYRFVQYEQKGLDITAGNFYEQFGSGLTLRSYVQPQLGIDNAIDGIRVKYNPYRGVYLTGLYGKMRVDFNDGLINSNGFVRGFDGMININELTDSAQTWKTRVFVGGSFVSRYQQDDNPVLILPENVGTWGGRMNISRGKVSMYGEYAYKINDPSERNQQIYKPGQALLLNATYATKGFGVVLDYKYSDNMDFRVDRDAIQTVGFINFLPSLTRPHSYNLAATLYPYNVQTTGEVAYQANVSYKFPRGSKIGGKYGMYIGLNYASAWNMDSTTLNDLDNTNPNTTRQGYTANFLQQGDDLYFQDFNVEIRRKFNKKFKATFMYFNFVYNNDINQGAYTQDQAVKGDIHANLYVLDMTYKIKRKHSLRTELQALFTEKHQGDWATIVVEYSYSPHWFVAVLDQYNYGNEDPLYRIHYLIGSVGYNNGPHRFSLSYGKQRAGLFCVGGVCRTVPASNGLTFTLSTSF